MPVVSDPSISGSNGRYTVGGELGFATVTQLLEQSRTTLFADDSGQLELDLSAVTRADSAGLALLLQWMRLARKQDRRISFRSLPPQLLAIAQTGELDSLLPLAE